VVACGYADGYPRHCTTGTPVLVDGVRTRMVGRVSMDMITVDLTPVPDAPAWQRGHAVGPWRRATGAVLPIDEVAQAGGTVATS
jgi:alanine racemase